jgi:quercetin dioxygenase-like cupin family protein
MAKSSRQPEPAAKLRVLDRVRFVSALIDPSTRPRWFFANLVEVKLTQEATGGQMSIVELSGPPGDMPPLHLHRTDDEAWYVLEGDMSFFVGTNEPVRVAAGALAFGSKDVPHTYRVESSQPARWLAICTPGDFGAFVLAASRPADRAGLPPPPGPPTSDEIAAITALALEHGIELLGPPGALPGEAHAH